jgi:hypothetical protein
VINFDDYSLTDFGFNNNLGTWSNGDFDGNGIVNFDDYALIDANFNLQVNSMPGATRWLTGEDRSGANAALPGVQSVMKHFAQFGDPYAQAFLGTNAVPEPSSAALIVGVVAGLGARRRRRA